MGAMVTWLHSPVRLLGQLLPLLLFLLPASMQAQFSYTTTNGTIAESEQSFSSQDAKLWKNAVLTLR